ncbi:MAG: hypothetical protein OXT67_13295 [Zetaproteobacteria bacterium]|nr:hypothetical protein [Zetaproteobacteria bacterium]
MTIFEDEKQILPHQLMKVQDKYALLGQSKHPRHLSSKNHYNKINSINLHPFKQDSPQPL